MFGKNDPVRVVELRLHDLSERRERLAGQLGPAASELDAAQTEQRAALIETDDPTTALSGKVAARVRDAEERKRALEDALRAIATQIEDTEAQLAKTRDTAERDRVAGILEADAKAADRVAADLDAAISALKKAYQTFVGSIPGHAPALMRAGLPLKPEAIAAIIFTAALDSALPGLFQDRPDDSRVLQRLGIAGDTAVATAAFDNIAAQGAAALAVTGRMRALAASIRAGNAPPVLPESVLDPEPEFLPHPGTAQIIVQNPFFYLDRGRHMVGEGLHGVPGPVARIAVSKGLALDAQTSEGRRAYSEHQKKFQSASAGYATRTTWDECIDLEFDLDAWRSTERERMRSEWDANQQQQAA